jgi:SAM-dependent methyltransferase
MQKELHEQNRIAWNAATQAHNSHKRDQAAFFCNGGSTLFQEEIDLLGDLQGKSLVHLQCNAGQDTLSLTRLGAQVVGVDISDEAVGFATRLSTDSGIPATFHRADIFDWLAQTADRYDVVFSSYGAVGWLSDLGAWGRGIARILKPGGRFVLVEFHPLLMVLGDDGQTLDSDYFGGKHYAFDDGIGDYVAMSGQALTPSGWLDGVQDFRNPHTCHEFAWGLADVITALVDGGLRLSVFREYPYSNGCKFFPDMQELPGHRFVLREGMPLLPLMFGLAAEKEA